MVVARGPQFRPEPEATVLVLSIETKAILLLDRTGAPTSAIAPAIRVGYIATAITVDGRGEIQGVLTAPVTVDRAMASHHLANLAITQSTMRGSLTTVGLIGDDASAEIVRNALRDLRTSGDVERWTEVLDPQLLRGRLGRLMAILEPDDATRDEILGGWDLALTFQPGAIDDVIGALRHRIRRLEGGELAAAEALVDYLDRHRSRADYGALRRKNIEVPVSVRRHHEYLPLRMTRARCRPITVERY